MKEQLSPEEIEALAEQLDALRAEVIGELGERDARYIRGIVRTARWSAIAGRSLLMFGIGPSSWLAGASALALAKILENMEIGHNVMHGQYDWMNDPALESQSYEWDNVCDAGQWRHSHNFQHHVYANIIGKDREVGHGVLRVTDSQPWLPRHRFQPLSNVVISLVFQWAVGIQGLDVPDNLTTPEGRRSIRAHASPFLRKAARQLVKDYVLFPAIALGNAPRVLLGNLTANGVRNIWTSLMSFCGHFPAGVRFYTESETAHESRGEWYVRQIEGSANIAGGRWLHVLSGHLSCQIEHHLFPDLPAHRYPEIAPRVRAICDRYRLSYNIGSFWSQYRTVLAGLVRRSVPTQRPAPRATA